MLAAALFDEKLGDEERHLSRCFALVHDLPHCLEAALLLRGVCEAIHGAAELALTKGYARDRAVTPWLQLTPLQVVEQARLTAMTRLGAIAALVALGRVHELQHWGNTAPNVALQTERLRFLMDELHEAQHGLDDLKLHFS
jgi:hypothetical protein